jgi:queuosine precursor transporter
MTKSLRYYDIFVAVFAAILLISNLAATKLVAFGPLILDGGAILFPLAYILGDVLTEVYGYKYARRAIWVAFGVMLLGVLTFTAVRLLPVATGYSDQVAFETVFGFFPRIVAASLAAFAIGSLMNSYVLAKLKVRTEGRFLKMRLIASTVVGEFLDTLVFALIAFGGVLTFGDMAIFVVVGWLYKTVFEIVLLPITARIIKIIKRHEKLDAYDAKTDFSPFKIGI